VWCTMHAAVENYLPATMNTGAYFTLRYADGGRERISPSALDVSPEPDAYTLHLAVRRPTPTTMHVDPATASTNCGICAAELAHAPTLCYLCTTPFHTSCISSSTSGPATPSPLTDGYDWFCSVCVEARGLDGSLFRSPVPLTHAHDTQQDDSELPAVRALTTSDDPRHPAEADTTPPIPNPPSSGNPARFPVEDAAADAVPIYLATKHNAYAPSKW